MTDQHPPLWTWTNSLRRRTTVTVDLSFKREEGCAFISLENEGDVLGTWLPAEQVDQMIAALAKARDHAEED